MRRQPLIAVDMTPMRPGGESGGNKVVALEVLAGIRRLEPEWRFLLLTAGWSHAELAGLESPGVDLLKVLPEESGRRSPPPIRELSGLLSARGVDLLFSPFTMATYAEPTIPFVAVVHDLQHLAYPQFFDPIEVREREAQLEQLAWLADRVICGSDSTRGELSERIDPERIRVVRNALPRDFALEREETGERKAAEEKGQTARKEDAREKGAGAEPHDGEAKAADRVAAPGLDGHRYFLYPANFWAHKNHRMLLVAYRILLARHPGVDVHLAFTGEVDERGRDLRDAVARMGLEDRVHLVGFVDERELDALYRASSGLVFPSLHEGFGMPVLEAMRLGVPVACSSTTSLPEVAGDGALLFDPRKPAEIAVAMHRLFHDEDLRADLVRRGRRRARELDATDVAAEYAAVFRDLLDEPPRHRDAISGVFADGWVGEAVSLTFGPGPEGRLWSLRLSAPGALPDDLRVTLQRGPVEARQWSVPRGATRAIQVLLPPEPGQLVLESEPGVRSRGERRWTTCVCERCRVVYPDATVLVAGSDERSMPRHRVADLARRHLHGFRPMVTSNRRSSYELEGVFDDGWFGELVSLTHGPGSAGRVWEIELQAPDRLEDDFLEVRRVGEATDGDSFWELGRGEARLIRIPLAETQGSVVLQASPCRRPSEEDDRLLAGRCAFSRIRYADGSESPLRRDARYEPRADPDSRPSSELLDRLNRLLENSAETISCLGERLAASEEDRGARLAVIERLTEQLSASESTIKSLADQLAASEEDRAARLAVIERLTEQLAASEATIKKLADQLATSEEDRSARLEAIDFLRDKLEARDEQIGALQAEIEQHRQVIAEQRRSLDSVAGRILRRLRIL